MQTDLADGAVITTETTRRATRPVTPSQPTNTKNWPFKRPKKEEPKLTLMEHSRAPLPEGVFEDDLGRAVAPFDLLVPYKDNPKDSGFRPGAKPIVR